MAADRAPGLTREYFGFLGWRAHDAALWARLRTEAEARAQAGAGTAVMIRGQDHDAAAFRSAQENAARAGVQRWARFASVPLADAAPLADRGGERPDCVHQSSMACAWRTEEARGWCTGSSATCCASDFRAGMAVRDRRAGAA